MKNITNNIKKLQSIKINGVISTTLISKLPMLKTPMLTTSLLTTPILTLVLFFIFFLGLPNKSWSQNIQPENIQTEKKFLLKTEASKNSAKNQQTLQSQQNPEPARKFISDPISVSLSSLNKSSSTQVKIEVIDEATIKNTIDKKVINKQAAKGSIVVSTTADAKDRIDKVVRIQQQKVANGKNKLDCQKLGVNLKCSYSNKGVLPTESSISLPSGIQGNDQLNIDGRNNSLLITPPVIKK